MKYEIIGTGSKGNAVIINNYIMIDSGVAYARLKEHVDNLKLVLLTHQHQDHFKKSTISALSSDRPTLRFACGEWIAKSLVDCGVRKTNIDILQDGRLYNFGAVKIEPIRLFHDVKNFGYKLYIGDEKMIYATDTSSLDGVVAKDFDLYMIEANHTEKEIESRIVEKLRAGEYSYEQKARDNHLSKEQADNFIYENIGEKGVYIYLHTHDGIII
jgi:phosphoribosyl 1,2-cyclic phosphodiesterase